MNAEELRQAMMRAANNLRFNQPVTPRDKYWVDLSAGRGDYSIGNAFFDLEQETTQDDAFQYYLLGGHDGHVGSGKSSELLYIKKTFYRKRATSGSFGRLPRRVGHK